MKFQAVKIKELSKKISNISKNNSKLILELTDKIINTPINILHYIFCQIILYSFQNKCILLLSSPILLLLLPLNFCHLSSVFLNLTLSSRTS